MLTIQGLDLDQYGLQEDDIQFIEEKISKISKEELDLLSDDDLVYRILSDDLMSNISLNSSEL